MKTVDTGEDIASGWLPTKNSLFDNKSHLDVIQLVTMLFPRRHLVEKMSTEGFADNNGRNERKE